MHKQREEGKKRVGEEGGEEGEEEERSRNHNCDDDNVVCLLSHLKSDTRTHLILPSPPYPLSPAPS